MKGRCLSYGEGITFWPLAEVVRQAGSISDKDSTEAARHKLGDLMQADERAIADRVGSIIGLSSLSFPMEELFWAARCFLEALARSGPLVIVFEDIHWAEATFVDWIEHVVDLADAPILVVCAARRELLENRPEWSRGSAKSSQIELQLLTGSESETLIHNLLGPTESTSEVAARITAAAQGNPLFVEQIISMWMENGTLHRSVDSWRIRTDISVSIPPTISALLSATPRSAALRGARGDCWASVIGQVFYRGAVEELSPVQVRSAVSASLSALMTQQFVRPDPSILANERAFAFRHVLIRDAAYQGLLSRTRAELHERFASWLEGVTGDRITEYEEIIGYHYEQAYKTRESLGKVRSTEVPLASRAAKYLFSAGCRAFERADMSAAVSLFTRCSSLIQADGLERLEILSMLAHCLTDVGQLTTADRALREAQALAETLGDRRNKGRLIIVETRLHNFTRPISHTRWRQQVERAISLLREVDDDIGLARAWEMLKAYHAHNLQADQARHAAQRQLHHSRRSKDPNEIAWALVATLGLEIDGPTPADKALGHIGDILRESQGSTIVELNSLQGSAILTAMQGRFETAESLACRAKELADELGLKIDIARSQMDQAKVRSLAGDLQSVVQLLEDARARLRELGHKRYTALTTVRLAHALCELNRYAEAESFMRPYDQSGVGLMGRFKLNGWR